MRRMIFHMPEKLYTQDLNIATKLRPNKMLQAFRDIGYEIFVISGDYNERKVLLKKLKKELLLGNKYDYLYSESSGYPTLLSEKNHIPRFPFIDYKLFSICKKQGIPIYLFYRDIYWKFPDYCTDFNMLKLFIARLFYKIDLLVYKHNVTRVLLPSLNMKTYIPELCLSRIDDLPPGYDFQLASKTSQGGTTLKLLYVGGLGNLYRIQMLIDVVKRNKLIELTICTREVDWDRCKQEYSDCLPFPSNINLVFFSGQELESLYDSCDLCVLWLEPNLYRQFAAPYKLFEYIGHRKPIIASKGTYVSDFIESNDIGFTADYCSNKLEDLLFNIVENRYLIEEKITNINKIYELNTWKARVLKVTSFVTV